MKLQTLVHSIVALLVLSLVSCGGDYNGQLLGEIERPNWQPEMPYGMVYVPSGTLHIGPSDQDINNARVSRSKSISIPSFYMDATEITNNEYRQFVNWVRDEMAHKILGHVIIDEYTGEEEIDWEQEIDWSNPETKEELASMYLPADDPISTGLKTDELVYNYIWIDWQTAAREPGVDRDDLIIEQDVSVYPDTLVWIRDFSYSYNEPLARRYFEHPAFDNYPVVGVEWDQANAFSAWRTNFWNDYKQEQGLPMLDDFRLPIEHEWEYAARGGLDGSPYPWGGPYTRNSKGCLLANFKPGRGNYPEDGGMYTVRADMYWANDYGLYNMAGNVSEWTSSAYYENSYSFLHDLSPDIRYDALEDESNTLKRKVIRGGSWKDIAYYIQTGTRHWEYEYETKSYIGFRCVSSYLGRDYRDNSF